MAGKILTSLPLDIEENLLALTNEPHYPSFFIEI